MIFFKKKSREQRLAAAKAKQKDLQEELKVLKAEKKVQMMKVKVKGNKGENPLKTVGRGFAIVGSHVGKGLANYGRDLAEHQRKQSKKRKPGFF